MHIPQSWVMSCMADVHEVQEANDKSQFPVPQTDKNHSCTTQCQWLPTFPHSDVVYDNTHVLNFSATWNANTHQTRKRTFQKTTANRLYYRFIPISCPICEVCLAPFLNFSDILVYNYRFLSLNNTHQSPNVNKQTNKISNESTGAWSTLWSESRAQAATCVKCVVLPLALFQVLKLVEHTRAQ